MSGARVFAAQVAQQRDNLRDRLAAVEYIAEVNAQAEQQAAYAKDRESGGMVFDPLDPTRVVVPVVWLRSLLNYARTQGYGVIANDPTMTALLAEWNANYHGSTGDEFESLEREHPELAHALRDFLAIL